MKAFGLLVGMLAIGVPIAWFASEFQGRRWLRLVLGSLAILLGFGVAVAIGSLERFNSNAWFGNASKNFVDATVAELEAGNRDGVLRSLKILQQKYSPTYENRARYDALIGETVTRMRARPHQSP
jgi:cytochrome c biogenesis protein CcdA